MVPLIASWHPRLSPGARTSPLARCRRNAAPAGCCRSGLPGIDQARWVATATLSCPACRTATRQRTPTSTSEVAATDGVDPPKRRLRSPPAVIPGMAIPGMAVASMAIGAAAEGDLPATTSMNSIAAPMGTCCMGWMSARAPPDNRDLPAEVRAFAERKDEPQRGHSDDDGPCHRDVGTETGDEHRGHRCTHHEMCQIVVIPLGSPALASRHQPAGVVQARIAHQPAEGPVQ